MAAPIDLFALTGSISLLTASTRAQAVDISAADFVPTYVSKEISATGGGVIYVDTLGGDVNVPVAIGVATALRLRVTKIYKAGSTATGLVVMT